MRKIVIYFKYLIPSFFILSSFLIAYNVSYPLFDIERNELNKKEVIGLTPSVPLEFSENNKFWWLIRGVNKLEFHNSSDEKIAGNIILTFEPNPCNYQEKIKLSSVNDSSWILLKANEQTKIEIPIQIKNKSQVPIYVEFLNKKSCFVKNGDIRDFGAKLVFWSFE